MNEEFKRQKIDTCLGGYKMVILNRGWFLSPKGHFAVSQGNKFEIYVKMKILENYFRCVCVLLPF